MFELVKALEDGHEELRNRVVNPISLNAGCELFIAFVTLFPHESEVSRAPSKGKPSRVHFSLFELSCADPNSKKQSSATEFLWTPD
jgi:hypothetical protein